MLKPKKLLYQLFVLVSPAGFVMPVHTLLARTEVAFQSLPVVCAVSTGISCGAPAGRSSKDLAPAHAHYYLSFAHWQIPGMIFFTALSKLDYGKNNQCFE